MFWHKRIYLDAAAGMRGNPSSPHEEGRKAREILEGARTAIARLLEVQVDDVIFTSGATEANALAIFGTVRAMRRNHRNNAHVLYLPSAHASLVENMQVLKDEGVTIEALQIRDGRVDIEALKKQLTVNTVLVSMEAVCGETGTIWNTREVAEILRDARSGSAFLASSGSGFAFEQPVAAKNTSAAPLLHVDASQAPLTEKITRAHFNADLLTFDGAKVGPLRGIGILVAHRNPIAGGSMQPLYRGGGQERGLRPGTENPEGALAFAAALRAAAENRDSFRARAAEDRRTIVEALRQAIPDVCINEGHKQAPNILNISLPGHDADYLVMLLNEDGFAVSTRSACEADSTEGSRAVLALTGDRERALATLRISWGPEIRRQELLRLVPSLTHCLPLTRS